MSIKSILVASPVKAAVSTIRETLGAEHRIDVAESSAVCFQMFQRKRYEFSFIDIEYLKPGEEQGGEGLEQALKPYLQTFPTAVIVALAPSVRIREAVQTVKAGTGGYLCYPLDQLEVLHLTESMLEWQKIDSELSYLRREALGADLDHLTMTRSPLMRDLLEKIELVAPTRTTVLLTGETGTGKSLLARLIHARGKRSEGPFISVHCGAIPETLVESELFGHEKGAFTGATRRRPGKFQIADKGTIFLDEIGTISPALQVKLLQVLQEGRFARVGGDSTVEVDVRVAAATNVDLPKLCREGAFRQDLYYRLNGFVIEVPPLRMRTEDIPHLVDIFIEKYNRTNHREIAGVEPSALAALKSYSWPGNIRELENIVDRACIVERDAILTPAAFPPDIFQPQTPFKEEGNPPIVTLDEMRKKTLEQADIQYLKEIMTHHRGAAARAAGAAGVTPRHFRNLLKKYGLCREDFK